MSSIKAFYAASSVFLTGGTGFLGKVMIEKMIRSCPEVQAIHILIRPKKGLSPEQRLVAIQNDQIFDRIRSENPSALNKLRVVSGDICSPRLGLSERSEETLLEEVSVAFHVAANVRFDEGMKDAAEQNTLATVRVMELLRRMQQLKSAVHVSTSYCNPQPEIVEEKIYECSNAISKEQFLQLMQTLPAPVMDIVGEQILGDHSNTYTFTKSMGEEVVQDYRAQFPLCVVRPSIVTSALSEPHPGWVDSPDGVTSFYLNMARGHLTSFMCQSEAIVDMVPVDLVANTVIAAAWANAQKQDKSEPMRVINCTSGEINPITWGEATDAVLKWTKVDPFQGTIRHPRVQLQRLGAVNELMWMCDQFMPAAVKDSLSFVRGEKPRQWKRAKSYKKFLESTEWVTRRNWRFKTERMREFAKEVEGATDGSEFLCDVSRIDWDLYMRNYLVGIRRFLLKEDKSSLNLPEQKLASSVSQ